MENNQFIKSILKYYTDFLETDFHKRRSPKRKILFTNADNQLIGLNLSRYPKFQEKILKLLNGNISTEELKITKGSYTNKIRESLLIKLFESIDLFMTSKKQDINTNLNLIFKNYLVSKDEELAKDDFVNNKITEFLNTHITPVFFNLNKSFLTDIGVVESDLESIIESLNISLVKSIREVFSETINKNETKELKLDSSVLVKILKAITKDYFASYSVSDLTFELGKLFATKKLLDKQDFYISIFDVYHEKNKFPIFYIPFELQEDRDTYTINFDAQLYINKKSIEFIIDEFRETMELKGKIEEIKERILYLSNLENPLEKIVEVFNDILFFFSFQNGIELKESFMNRSFKINSLSFNTNLYLNIFDKSDDALVNDYEELLDLINVKDSNISELFNNIVENFLLKETISIGTNVEDEWDELDTVDKLTYNAPIPLNEEQIKILSALKNDKCKYVVVQGPPGTGKSHTITAIVFDMILNNKSVLVLSDKKEALDVVEDKITKTLNKVRTEDDFQNPILRLGKSGNTYSQILAQTTIDKIRNSNRVMKNTSKQIDESIESINKTLRDEINSEEENYSKIDLSEIVEFFTLDEEIGKIKKANGLKDKDLDVRDFENLIKYSEQVKEFKEANYFPKIEEIAKLYKFNKKSISIDDLNELLKRIQTYNSLVSKTLNKFNGLKKIFDGYKNLSEKEFAKLLSYYNEYVEQDNKFLKFTFNKKKLESILSGIKKINDNFDEKNYIDELNKLSKVLEARAYIADTSEDFEITYKIFKNLINEDYFENESTIKEFIKKLDALLKPKTGLKSFASELNTESIENFSDNLKLPDVNEIKKIIRHKLLEEHITSTIGQIDFTTYVDYKKEVQYSMTQKTISILDANLLSFYDNNTSTARILRKIIQKKQKFPKTEFLKLKDAFPCILSGIRDYAEYIPLEADLFDLIIIDEASQVSIAQALPALIRAKKVLVLGDKKQFSNVKSAQARNDLNKEYTNSLKDTFVKAKYKDVPLQKLDYFDIKSSVLLFFELIGNYQTMLYKYFRGYKEIISYSNKYFYNNQLQIMKIRGKNINEVIKFKKIEHDNKAELTPKTNKLEVDYIIKSIEELYANNFEGDVGIITPHTNQQKLLLNEFRKLTNYSDIDKKFNLKIMTFDTCQGEERDIIYYSMVANPVADSLWGVFSKDFKDMDFEEDGKLRAQRLNVGFSRAKEQMHFVISKNTSEFTGEIGNALRHYENIIEISKKEKPASTTDAKSPMESKILDWIYKTDFWSNNSDYIEVQPQFELGKFLSQEKDNYNHPFYRVDFLFSYKKDGKNVNIIIEYDGFKEHFKELQNVDANNYQDYYNDEDILRQKTLESYGYKFLRVNKFNLGESPAAILNSRLIEIIESQPKSINQTLKEKIAQNINGLNLGEKKECPKCNKVLDMEEFHDESLARSYGRICKTCKKDDYVKPKTTNSSSEPKTKTVKILRSRSDNYSYSGDRCPRCNKRLVSRRGKYGSFTGCSGYPYCNYTR